MFRRAGIILTWLLFLALPVWSRSAESEMPKLLNIQAESISYNQNDFSAQAQKIKEFTFENFVGSCEALKYSGSRQELLVKDGYTLRWGRSKLSGSSFNFNFLQKTGQSNDAHFSLGKIVLFGKKVVFSEKEIRLDKASFTTCDLPTPHFELVADKIIVYPEKDLLITQWDVLKIFNVPVAFLPAYILSSSWLGVVTENQTLLPEIGYDQINGLRVEERAGYFINENFTGTLDLGYSTRRKFIIGNTSGYQINPSNGGSFRFHYFTKDEWEGGLTHQVVFGAETLQTGFQKLFYRGPTPDYQPLAESVFKLSHGEIINNYEVSFLPLLTVRSGNFPLFWGSRVQGKIEAGRIRESNNQNLLETGLLSFNTKVFYNRSDELGQFFESILEFNLTKYDKFPNWRWIKGSLSQRIIGFNRWQTILGYQHYFYKYSENPFRFQDLLLRPNDEIYCFNKWDLGPFKLGFNYYYDFMKQAASDIDYQADFDCHCLILSLKWKSLRQEFSLGVNLKVL